MNEREPVRGRQVSSYGRQALFERLMTGLLTDEQLSRAARELGFEPEAGRYAVAIFTVPPAPLEAADFVTDPAAAVRSALLADFLKYTEYVPAPWGPDACALLIQGQAQDVERYVRRCVRNVGERYAAWDPAAQWYVAVAEPVDRAEDIPACFREASRLWAMRFLLPEQRVLTARTARRPSGEGEEGALAGLDPSRAHPRALEAFLQEGDAELDMFVRSYMQGLGTAMEFRPFREYVMLSARFAAQEQLLAGGLSRRQALERLPAWQSPEGPETAEAYVKAALAAALSLKGEAESGALGRARAYVDSHFAEAALTLRAAAAQAGVSASYLSALFRQRLGCTFTQYVTARRMRRACQLLRETNMPSGQVAAAVGYRDRRYFCALFKRIHGCAPGQYRAGEKPGK